MSEARPALADFPPQVAWLASEREQRELQVPLGRAMLPAWEYSLVAVR